MSPRSPRTPIALALLLLAGCTDYGLFALDKRADEAPSVELPDPQPEPRLDLEPALHLSSHCLGADSGRLYLESAGEGALTIDQVRLLEGAGAAELELGALALPAVLERGEALEVEVAWTPASGAEIDARLVVSSDDPGRPEAEAAVIGTHQDNLAPALTVEFPICSVVAEDQGLRLTATVADDGPTEDLWIRWESDRDGLLHEGPADADGRQELQTFLSGGDHVVTVTVTDACGEVGGASHPVQVVPYGGVYLPQSPDGLSFDADGYLWVADWETDRVVRINPASFEILWEFALPYSGADGLTLLGDRILVSFFHSNQVVTLDACTGAQLGSWPSPTPGGVADVSWDGSDLWVVDYLDQEIHRVDPDTGLSLEVFDAPYPFSNGLTFDGENFWLTSNFETNRIARLDGNFDVLQEVPHGGTDPRGIAWDGTWIWWSDGTAGLVEILTAP